LIFSLLRLLLRHWLFSPCHYFIFIDYFAAIISLLAISILRWHYFIIAIIDIFITLSPLHIHWYFHCWYHYYFLSILLISLPIDIDYCHYYHYHWLRY
jgi:hypothetical protein